MMKTKRQPKVRSFFRIGHHKQTSLSGLAAAVTLLVLSSFLGLSACNGTVQDASEYRQQSQTYRVNLIPEVFSYLFEVTTGGTVELDVLIVIDDSGSMGDEQVEFQAGVASLIGELRSVTGLDYRIAITTTDPDAADLCTLYSDKDGNAVRDYNYYDTTDTDAEFENGVGFVGLAGSGDERPLQVAQNCLEGSYDGSFTVDGNANNDNMDGFFRDNAFWAFIIVTDENECSNGAASGCGANDTDFFTAVRDRIDLIDDTIDNGSDTAADAEEKASLWGIIKWDGTSNGAGPYAYDENEANVFLDAMALFDGAGLRSTAFSGATDFYPASTAASGTGGTNVSTAGHALDIGPNPSPTDRSDYSSFLSNVGQVLAGQALALLGTDDSSLPISGAGSIELYVGGSQQSESLYRYKGDNEIQKVEFDATADSGSFSLSFRGSTSSAISFGSTAAQVKTILEAILGSGNVLVACPGGTEPCSMALGHDLLIEFTGDLAGLELDEMTVGANTLMDGVTPVNITYRAEDTANGDADTQDGEGSNEIQSIDFTVANPTGGTFTIVVEGASTAEIAYDATAAQVQAALEKVVGSGNVYVSGAIATATDLTIEFQGSLTGQGIDLMTLTNSLAGGTTINGGADTATAGQDGVLSCSGMPAGAVDADRLYCVSMATPLSLELNSAMSNFALSETVVVRWAKETKLDFGCSDGDCGTSTNKIFAIPKPADETTIEVFYDSGSGETELGASDFTFDGDTNAVTIIGGLAATIKVDESLRIDYKQPTAEAQ